MSCWVVPTIAAELWGVPLQNILDNVKSGKVASKTDSGFTFVDVAPGSPVFRPKSGRQPKPATYTVVTHEEMVALTGSDEYADESAQDMGDWKQARGQAEQLRRAPVAV